MTTLQSINTTSPESAWFDDYCEFSLAGIIIVLLIAAVNCLHLVLLSKLSKISTTPNLKILIIMSVDDICVCFMRAIRYLSVYCYLGDMMANPTFPYLNVLLRALWFTVVNLRFYVLTAASYDRYIAVCKPFSHLNNWLLRHIGMVLFLLGVLIFSSFSTVYASRFCNACLVQKICESVSALTIFSADSTERDIIEYLMLFWTALACVPAAVFTFYLLRELRKLRSNPPNYSGPSYTRAVIKTANLVLVIILLFIICLIPSFLTHLIVIATGVTRFASAAIEYTNLAFEFYGIFNVIVYGLMNRTYQQELKNILKITPKN